MSGKTKSTLTAKLKNSTSRLGLRALEPRILLDAAGFVTGADGAMDALDTVSISEDMSRLFENAADTIAPTDNVAAAIAPTDVDELLSALNVAEANQANDGESDDTKGDRTAILDDGGKDYYVKAVTSVVINDGNCLLYTSDAADE